MGAKIKDFLINDDFIHYTLRSTPQLDGQWGKYFEKYPEEITEAEVAKEILLAPHDVDCPFSEMEKEELRDKIISKIKGV